MFETDDYLFQKGLLEFEIGNYEKCIEYFIECFTISTKYRKQIIENIYSCFVIPNKNEFFDNYYKLKSENEICSIDFIPVSETKFYTFNRTKCEFEEPVDIKWLSSNSTELDIRAVFISDCSCLSTILEVIGNRIWAGIYLLDDGQNEAINSLYKLPGWAEYVNDKIVVFKNKTEVEEYFRVNIDKYIPKLILSDEKEEFEDLFRMLHNERLNKKRDDIKPVLSICIPTYNRGSSAIERIKTVLNSNLDYEIEVFVSDNGSTIGVDDYKKIQNSTDSRLRYVRLDSNIEYYGNIINCLNNANGQFAMIISDEDYIIVENLIVFINYLINHSEAAGFNLGDEDIIKAKGIDAVSWGTINNYVSGLTFNITYMKKSLDIVTKNDDNYYCRVYTHCALLVALGVEYDLCQTTIPVVAKGKEASFSVADENKSTILSYATYESRVKQLDDFAKYIDNICNDEILKRAVLLNHIQNIFGMLEMAKKVYPDKINFFNVCCSLYSYVMMRIRNKYFAFATLDYNEIYKILSDMASHYLIQSIDNNRIIRYIQRFESEVEEYTDISGYDYMSHFEKISKN